MRNWYKGTVIAALLLFISSCNIPAKAHPIAKGQTCYIHNATANAVITLDAVTKDDISHALNWCPSASVIRTY